MRGETMTPQEKMQKVVEAAGECWQEGNPTRFISTNPSPTDLNELFRLAKKLNLSVELDVTDRGYTQVSLHKGPLSPKPVAQSIEGLPLEEALLNALNEATKDYAALKAQGVEV